MDQQTFEYLTRLNIKAALDRAEEIGIEKGLLHAAKAVRASEWWHGNPATGEATSCSEDMARRIEALKASDIQKDQRIYTPRGA